MFAYALLVAVVAAKTYTQAGPTLATEASGQDSAVEMMTSEFSYANNRVETETKVATVNTSKAKVSGDKKFGTDLMKAGLASCITMNDVGRTCTPKKDDQGQDTDEYDCTGDNKYMCFTVNAEYTDGTTGTGTI